MTRFLVDECCARAVVLSLREQGHDVRYAAESDSRSEDSVLLRLATAEGRILVTEDFDFADLVFRDGLRAPGIIILYLPGQRPQERADRLVRFLARQGAELLDRLTVVTARRIRQRHFPPDT